MWHQRAANQLLRQSLNALADVPPSQNPLADWRRHHIDRSMSHYQAVMQWVYLLLFQRGLTTFSGGNTNQSLLFPMEQVFEDFLVASFRRHQHDYTVVSKKRSKFLTTINDQKQAVLSIEPDIALCVSKEGQSQTQFILDAKWKQHEIERSDVFQLHAYATRHECPVTALVYPRNTYFESALHYRFFNEGRTLLAIPFNVAQPQDSVRQTIEDLLGALALIQCTAA